MDNKKSVYRILAEALTFEKLNKVELSLGHLDKRKMSIAEIKVAIREAFKDAKAAAEVEAQELAHGWGDAEIENEIQWVKALNLKEFIDPHSVLTESTDEDDDEKEEDVNEGFPFNKDDDDDDDDEKDVNEGFPFDKDDEDDEE